MSDEAASPVSVLVLGGMGMIGRAFVSYLARYNLAQHIRICDKTMPSMASLSPELKDLIEKDPRVEFVQTNLVNPEHVERAFTPSGKCPHAFQLAVNVAAFTDIGRPDEIYKQGIYDLRILCASVAAKKNIDMYVEVSTGQVYEGKTTKPNAETAKCDPWTVQAKMHYAAEQAIQGMVGLRYCIVRLAYVYGPADRLGLMPRLACAAIYEHVGKTMNFLWGDELRIHCIHVQDVAALLYHVMCLGDEAVGQIFNAVDDSDLSQGRFNSEIVEPIFKVKTNCRGAIVSMAAQMKIEEIVEEANGGHMDAWMTLLLKNKVDYSPVSPILDAELLKDRHMTMDGSKLKATGFTYSCPKISKELVLDSLKYWAKLNRFPAQTHPEFYA